MWPFTRREENPKPSSDDLCCLNKQKEAAINKQKNLELEIEAKLKSDHPEYAAYERLLSDIIEARERRSCWSAYQEGRLRDETGMVVCAEAALIGDLREAKARYRQQILDEDCKKGESLFTSQK